METNIENHYSAQTALPFNVGGLSRTQDQSGVTPRCVTCQLALLLPPSTERKPVVQRVNHVAVRRPSLTLPRGDL